MVSVICCTFRDRFMENIFRNYENQDLKKKELIIILNSNAMDLAKWKERAKRSKNVRVYQRSKKISLGECLNYGIQRSNYLVIAKMDDDDYYAPPYLSQQLKALRDKKAHVVCKTSVFMYFQNRQILALHLADWGVNKFVNKTGGIKGSTLVMKKFVWRKVHFPHINLNEDHSFLEKIMQRKIKIYSTDKYNYVCIRRAENEHTWRERNQYLLLESKTLRRTKHYKYLVKRGN